MPEVPAWVEMRAAGSKERSTRNAQVIGCVVGEDEKRSAVRKGSTAVVRQRETPCGHLDVCLVVLPSFTEGTRNAINFATAHKEVNFVLAWSKITMLRVNNMQEAREIGSWFIHADCHQVNGTKPHEDRCLAGRNDRAH